MTDPPDPICVGCKVEMVILTHGKLVITEIRGRMYEIWSGPEWRCPKCSQCIVLIPPLVVSYWTDDSDRVKDAVDISPKENHGKHTGKQDCSA